MTPNEFKAWFDGFTEAFTGCPTKAQWTRIKTRVAEIDGKAVTQTVYLDRYWPTYVRTYPHIIPNWATTYCGPATTGVVSNTYAGNAVGQAQCANNLASLGQNYQQVANNFNSLQAMTDLGRAEAAEAA